ncbi:MAG: alkyl sulfatase dimerization domain-containing protein [Myxococcales bacterium]|jgi:glyoxylase-like metal-dependent hydrolase (beta-lactamase superfamily II)
MQFTPLQRMHEMRGKGPDEAKFYWSGGPVELAPRTFFASVFSGVTAFETDAGLVLVDSGLKLLSEGIAGLIRQKTSAPVHTAVFTQGHVDHAFGLKAFLSPGQDTPRVVAHRKMPARFARYARTAGHNAALNARQFGAAVTAFDDADDARTTFQAPELPPDTFYDERVDLVVGGETFQVHHCEGETDDHSWVFAPERGVLCPGDLFIWGVPNAGNPQKVQRYPWSWAAGLRAMAACQPRSMGPGHGGPIVDEPDRLQQMLHETADYLDAIVEQTLAAMNDGAPPHVDIVQRVRIPKSDSPWLQPVYDEGEFIVRNVIRYFGGWYSGRPSELKPAARAAVAGEVAELAGGPVALLQRARERMRRGERRLACHLADYALEAAPDDAGVREGVAEIYEQRAEGETSLMAVNLFRSAAAYAREGRPFA